MPNDSANANKGATQFSLSQFQTNGTIQSSMFFFFSYSFSYFWPKKVVFSLRSRTVRASTIVFLKIWLFFSSSLLFCSYHLVCKTGSHQSSLSFNIVNFTDFFQSLAGCNWNSQKQLIFIKRCLLNRMIYESCQANWLDSVERERKRTHTQSLIWILAKFKRTPNRSKLISKAVFCDILLAITN